MDTIGTFMGGRGPEPDAVRCSAHGVVLGTNPLGSAEATARCPQCWAIFVATCMRCTHLDELRSRMTGAICDGCESSEVHRDYGPYSERFHTRGIRYDPRRDGVFSKRDMKRLIRLTYGCPFPG